MAIKSLVLFFLPFSTLFQGDNSLIHDPRVNKPVQGKKICLASRALHHDPHGATGDDRFQIPNASHLANADSIFHMETSKRKSTKLMAAKFDRNIYSLFCEVFRASMVLLLNRSYL